MISYLLSLNSMENIRSVQESSLISMEKIIGSIRELRNQRINELTHGSGLITFLEEHFGTFAISPVKQEFLKRDLKELQNSTLDLAHYSSLIKQMKEADSPIADTNHPLFIHELKAIFKKYGF